MLEPTGRPADRTVARGLVGCVLIACVALSAVLAVGGACGLVMQLGSPDPTVPHPLFLAALTAVILLALLAFFVLVIRRLYAAWRGAEPAELVPKWLSVTLALALGIGALVALTFGGRPTAGGYGAYGASGAFLGYAVAEITRAIRARRQSRARQSSI